MNTLNLRETAAAAYEAIAAGNSRFASNIRAIFSDQSNGRWQDANMDTLEMTLGFLADAAMSGMKIDLDRVSVKTAGQAMARIVKDCPLLSHLSIAGGADDVKIDSVHKKGEKADGRVIRSLTLVKSTGQARVVYFTWKTGKAKPEHNQPVEMTTEFGATITADAIDSRDHYAEDDAVQQAIQSARDLKERITQEVANELDYWRTLALAREAELTTVKSNLAAARKTISTLVKPAKKRTRKPVAA